METNLINEWDSIASTRSRQIRTGLDTSFNKVLMPSILDSIKKYDLSNILDAGCGTGEITLEVSKISNHIDAIDFSTESLKLAQEYCASEKNINFYNSPIESFKSNDNYSVIYSNMVFMDIECCESAINNIYHLLKDDGTFIFTIIHPCLWSVYRNYYQNIDFDYFKQKMIEQPFDIGKEKGTKKTVHYHRPLEYYINTLVKNNFIIKEMKELKGDNFNLPRFMMLTCKKL